MKQSKSQQRKRSETIVSIGNIPLTSQKLTSMTCQKLLQKNKGPLIANVFMCHIKEKLENQKKMCAFYGCYADDTPCKMTDVSTASVFQSTLNEIHPSLSSTMELKNSKLPLVSDQLIPDLYYLTKALLTKSTDILCCRQC